MQIHRRSYTHARADPTYLQSSGSRAELRDPPLRKRAVTASRHRKHTELAHGNLPVLLSARDNSSGLREHAEAVSYTIWSCALRLSRTELGGDVLISNVEERGGIKTPPTVPNTTQPD